jgi:cytochrome P450
MIGNRKFQPKKTILGSIWFSHRDETKWNAGRKLADGTYEHPLDEFLAERFLEYPDDPFSDPLKKEDGSEKAPSALNDSKGPGEARPTPKFTTEGLSGLYIPFGGGLKTCPGRHYAKQEMYLTVATILWAIDFEFVDLDKAKATKPNMKAFAVGTLHPDRKNDVRIRRRKVSH